MWRNCRFEVTKTPICCPDTVCIIYQLTTTVFPLEQSKTNTLARLYLENRPQSRDSDIPTKILADKLTPRLYKLGRRGIFQHDNKQLPKSHKSMTWHSLLYVSWLESNRTLLGYFKEKDRTTQPLQQNRSAKEYWVCHEK